MSTILQIGNADRNLSRFIQSVRMAGLEDTLNGLGPFTLLAPINVAFGNMIQPLWEEFLKPINRLRLLDVLSFHILREKCMLRDFFHGQKLSTINGMEVNVTVNDRTVRINGSMIVAADREGCNGVINSVNAVNIPESLLQVERD